jgi:hypothetical protein
LSIEVANVERLLSENMVSELGEALNKFERLDFSIFRLNLIGDLVWALCAKPLISPLLKVQITLRMTFIVASLK